MSDGTPQPEGVFIKGVSDQSYDLIGEFEGPPEFCRVLRTETLNRCCVLAEIGRSTGPKNRTHIPCRYFLRITIEKNFDYKNVWYTSTQIVTK